MKILYTVIVSIVLFIFTVLTTGAGHGTFLIVKIVYPYTMIIAQIQNIIEIPGILLAIFQIPIYAYIFTKKPKWKYSVIGLHILAVIICLCQTGGIYN